MNTILAKRRSNKVTLYKRINNLKKRSMTLSNIVIAAIVFIVAVILLISSVRLVGLTKWNLIDDLRLNKLFKRPRRESLSPDDVKIFASKTFWDKTKNGKVHYRNGMRLERIQPMSLKDGRLCLVISRDVRPYASVCQVFINTDATGEDMKATTVTKDLKSYENMMNIMRYDLRKILNNLTFLKAGNEEIKQKIVNEYILYILREIL